MSKDILIQVVLDESGSMTGMERDTVDGFNNFIAEQKEVDGKAYVSLVKFNTDVKEAYVGKDINDVPLMKVGSRHDYAYNSHPNSHYRYNFDYRPGGGTALNDAIADGIERAEDFVLKEDVLVVIITDGQDNSSVKFRDPKEIAVMVEQKIQHGWNFIYFGSNEASFESGLEYGIPKDNIIIYSSDETKEMYGALSNVTSEFRTGGVVGDRLGAMVVNLLGDKPGSMN